MSTSIRKARESDYEALCRLWAQGDALHARIRPEFFGTAPGMPRPFGYLGSALSSDEQIMLVADVRQELVGFVHVKVFDTPESATKVPRRRGHVEDMVVEQEYRRQGIGRALMEEAARWCRDQGATQIVLTVWEGNQHAEAFYRRLGYRPVSRVMGLVL
jgi:ribosomal protein S18 acetylase RimI-like enzyme